MLSRTTGQTGCSAFRMDVLTSPGPCLATARPSSFRKYSKPGCGHDPGQQGQKPAPAAGWNLGRSSCGRYASEWCGVCKPRLKTGDGPSPVSAPTSGMTPRIGHRPCDKPQSLPADHAVDAQSLRPRLWSGQTRQCDGICRKPLRTPVRLAKLSARALILVRKVMGRANRACRASAIVKICSFCTCNWWCRRPSPRLSSFRKYSKSGADHGLMRRRQKTDPAPNR